MRLWLYLLLYKYFHSSYALISPLPPTPITPLHPKRRGWGVPPTVSGGTTADRPTPSSIPQSLTPRFSTPHFSTPSSRRRYRDLAYRVTRLITNSPTAASPMANFPYGTPRLFSSLIRARPHSDAYHRIHPCQAPVSTHRCAVLRGVRLPESRYEKT